MISHRVIKVANDILYLLTLARLFLAAAAVLKKFNIFPVLSAVSLVLFSVSP